MKSTPEIISATYNLLKRYLPNFIKIFNPSESELDKIYRTFVDYENNIEQEFIGKGDLEITIDGNIPASIGKMEKNPNENSSALLNFIDVTCKQLLEILPENKLKMIKNNILDSMVYNKELRKSRFLTSLGELAVINQLVDEKKVFLDQCEAKLPNKKCFDFLFTINNKKIYVEVLNILNVRSDCIKSTDDLNNFFNHRLEQKLSKKLNDLEHPNNNYGFLLQPVIWGDIYKLRKYKNFFIDYDKKYDIVSPICLIGPYREPASKELLYIFEPVSNRFNKYDDYEKNET